MPNIFLVKIVIFIFLSLLSSTAFSAAQKGITDITFTHNNNDLLVSAVYREGFTPEIKKEIINGVSRDFFYYIVLHRVMPSWLDEEKVSKTIKYTVKYDILKNQFIVVKSEVPSKEEQVFDSYNEMVEWVSRIDRVSLAPLKILGRHHKYYISIKAEIKAGNFPFLLRYFLFFIPYSKFSTDWTHSRKFMLKDLK